MIELVHLEKRYGDVVPLKDVSVTINDGDVISVIGPSGTGKSTLLRCINMLETPTSGQILLDGVDITAPKYDLTLAPSAYLEDDLELLERMIRKEGRHYDV